MNPALAQGLPLLAPLVFAAFIVLRNARAKKLSVQRLWIFPAFLILAAALTESPLPDLPTAAALALALAVGTLIGWYRGRLTRINIDAATGQVTSQASMAGMVLIIIVFAARYALRSELMGPGVSSLHLNALAVTDGLLLLSVGMLSVQRLEIWLRCRKLVAEATPPTTRTASSPENSNPR